MPVPALAMIPLSAPDPASFLLYEAFDYYSGLIKKVIRQTKRRVVLGETVPAQEKVVSIFEPHTDIIVKDRCDTIYVQKAV